MSVCQSAFTFERQKWVFSQPKMNENSKMVPTISLKQTVLELMNFGLNKGITQQWIRYQNKFFSLVWSIIVERVRVFRWKCAFIHMHTLCLEWWYAFDIDDGALKTKWPREREKTQKNHMIYFLMNVITWPFSSLSPFGCLNNHVKSKCRPKTVCNSQRMNLLLCDDEKCVTVSFFVLLALKRKETRRKKGIIVFGILSCVVPLCMLR